MKILEGMSLIIDLAQRVCTDSKTQVVSSISKVTEKKMNIWIRSHMEGKGHG